MFSKATLKERRQYYREEWSTKDLPDFILKDLKKREFGFDHNGRDQMTGIKYLEEESP